ncbi:MAG: hypothetical protein WCW35_04035 [Bacteroidota bacterium]
MMYNPVTLILNGSYDVLQFEGETKHLDMVRYRQAGAQVIYNLTSPLAVISRYGGSKFLRQELLPLSFTPTKMQWWPNYNLHLLGGGMTFVKMTEWYDYYGFPNPQVSSLATMAVYHYLNEVVEMRNHTGDNVDPISDVYIFDIGGILLFSSDNVKQFFSQTVVMSDWSGQPLFSLRDGTLSNNGQFFSFKWKIPTLDHWHLFYLSGVEGIVGLSYRKDDGASISAAAGMIGSRRNTLNRHTFEQSVSLQWRAGLFYDQDNSLLASLYVSGLPTEMIKLNIYPGYIDFAGLFFGGVLSVSQNGHATFGLTMNWFPGVSMSTN